MRISIKELDRIKRSETDLEKKIKAEKKRAKGARIERVDSRTWVVRYDKKC